MPVVPRKIIRTLQLQLMWCRTDSADVRMIEGVSL